MQTSTPSMDQYLHYNTLLLREINMKSNTIRTKMKLNSVETALFIRSECTVQCYVRNQKQRQQTSKTWSDCCLLSGHHNLNTALCNSSSPLYLSSSDYLSNLSNREYKIHASQAGFDLFYLFVKHLYIHTVSLVEFVMKIVIVISSI